MGYKSRRKPIWDYLYIIMGTILLALSINVLLEPLDLVTGGVTGLAIVVKSLTETWLVGGIPVWLTNIVVNVPLFLTAVLLRGKDFGGRSLFATVFLSMALYGTQWVAPITDDLLLGSIFGGALAGLGLGLVFLAFSTTGGTDLAASIIHVFLAHHSIAKIMMALDAAIIIFGMYVFGIERALYALIAVFITSKLIDGILDGFSFSKAAFIISDHHDQIANDILHRLDRGVTALHGQGLYTGVSKNILLCVVAKKEIVLLKSIVKAQDKNAFVIVADVREVLGEGFNEYKDV